MRAPGSKSVDSPLHDPILTEECVEAADVSSSSGDLAADKRVSAVKADQNALIASEAWRSSEPFEPVLDDAVAFSAPPGTTALALSVLIFSSSSSVYVLLNSTDEETFSPCNVLCTSNTYGVIFMVLYLVVYKKTLTTNHVRRLTRIDLGALLVGSILYQVVGPYFFYLALDSLSVPAASILQRLESLYFLFLSYMFLRADISAWALVSASLSLFGVLLATFWNSIVGEQASYPRGIMYIIISGFAYSGSLLTTKKYLSQCNTGLVAIARSVVGTILFHLVSISMGQSDSLYKAKAWILTLPFGFIYVFMGQVAWTTALQRAKPVYLSVGTSALFPMTLTWSAIVINTFPNTSQWVAAVFIVLGIASSVSEAMYKDAKKENDGNSSSLREVSPRSETPKNKLISMDFLEEEEKGAYGSLYSEVVM